MVQIDFLDRNVISNLVPVMTLRPDILCMVYDEDRIKPHELTSFKKAVLRKNQQVIIKEYGCDSNDIDDIMKVLVGILDEHKGYDDICVDLTGGPELMTAAACMLGSQGKVKPYYLDLEKEQIFNVYNREEHVNARRITLNDYITAKGASHFSDSRTLPMGMEFDRILQMAEIIFDNLEEWKILNKYLASYFYGYSGMHFSINNIKCSRDRMRGIREIANGFAELGFTSYQNKEGKYVINSNKYKEYIITYGIWLEMYVYIKALECYDEVHLGYIIDWNSDDGSDTNDNEFDVVIMHNNHPVFISCKMTKPTSKDLTEIGYLSKRLGGEDAACILATTFPVKATSKADTSLYYRMKKLDVGLLETRDFKKSSTNQAFEQALAFCSD